VGYPGRGIPSVPYDKDTACSGLQFSPCNACFPFTFHASVWLAYAPLFQFLLGAFYGPIPLLIVLADIHRVMQANYSRPQPNIRSEAEPRKFLSTRLMEYYLMEPALEPSEAKLPSESSAAQLDIVAELPAEVICAD
jgi:hypothetical protein